MQCNDFDCETIQSAIYKIHISSLNWTKLRFGLQIRFGCTGRQSPSLLGQSGQEWSIADSITILGRTKQSLLILSSYLSQVSRSRCGLAERHKPTVEGGCPRPLSSTLPGQISRCHTSVITVDMDKKYISLGTGAPPSQPNTPARSYRYQCINVSNNCK